MPSPRRSAQESLHDIEVLKKHGSIRQAAIAEGVAPSTMAHRVRRIRETFPGSLPDATKQGTWAKDDQWQGESPAFEYPEIPDDEPSYEELKDRQIKDFQRLKANRDAAKLIQVRVKIEGPYGVMVKGDPHVDDAGTDWPLLNRHIEILKKTEGLFGANLGDLTNNWVGRLSRLYANQNVSRSRAIILAEGYLREIPWLWIDPGNHDLFSGADDPVKWITRFAGIHYKWQGSRIELVPPSGASVTVNSRHDHPGHSQYHPTHGPLKAAIWDSYHDDLYTCCHIHSGGYMIYAHNNGKVSHIFRASGYKVFDTYKDERGFMAHAMPAGVFVINPHATTDISRITFYAEPEAGAEALTWQRKRFAAGKSADIKRK